MNYTPLISVILPVYNAQKYLSASIESILKQTYTNFELLILNDGSTDGSEKICHSFDDKRIKYFYHSNIGLAATLNKGLQISIGDFIARQDGDDISHLTRFEDQVTFFKNNTDVILLGTRARIFTDDKTVGYHNHAIHPAVLKFDLMFDNPFVHSSVMFKQEAILKTGLYNTDRNFFEDYDLWSKFSVIGKVANLKNVLVDYRHHDMGLSKGNAYYNKDAVYKQSLQNIILLTGHDKEVFRELAALYHWKAEKCKGLSVQQLFSGLKEIANKIILLYPHEEALILGRLKQYQKIIRYRLNINERRLFVDNPLKIFALKVQNKILCLQPHLINN